MARKRAFRVANGSLTEVIRSFMLSDKFLKNKPGTIENNRHLLRLVLLHDLSAMRVNDIRPSHVQAFLDTMVDRPGARSNALVALKALEKWAIVRDKLPHHITTGTEAPRDDDGYTPWTEEHIRIAERGAPQHLARVVTLAGNTGQRGSDLVRMRWSDIQSHSGRAGIAVKQLKTGLEVWVPFTKEFSQIIAGWDRRPGFILFKEDGRPWTREQLSCQWLRARQKLPGLEDTVIHGLRGSAVVRFRRAGLSALEIGSLVGMSPKMVSRYSRKSDQIENALAAISKFERTDVGRNEGFTKVKQDLSR